jgi:hypothetical protein
MGNKSNINALSSGYYYANSGDDIFDGRSLELPKKLIQTAYDGARDLGQSTTFVKEAQGGLYFEDVEMFDGVLFEGTQTTIITSGLVGVEAASNLSFRPQTLVNNTENATVLLADEVSSFGANMSAMIIGGDGGIGVEIKNDCDDVFFTISQVQMRGDGNKGVMVTGSCATPIDFNFNTASFCNDNSTFFDYAPTNPTDLADLNISSLFNSGDGVFVGTTGFSVSGGILKVRAGSIVAETAMSVQAGGVVTVSANVIAGNTTVVDGSCVYDTVGVIFGNLSVSGAGTLQSRGSTIFGNIESSDTSNLSVHANQIQGNLTIGAGTTAFVVIGDLTGSLTVDGTLHGIINDQPYGNWVQGRTKIAKLIGSATTASDYSSAPQIALSEVINVTYTRAEISFSFESSNSTANRSTVAGLFINGVLQGIESDVEPKDSNNYSYQCKNIDATLLIGNNTIEVKYGVGNGLGGALATVSNVLILVKEMII